VTSGFPVKLGMTIEEGEGRGKCKNDKGKCRNNEKKTERRRIRTKR